MRAPGIASGHNAQSVAKELPGLASTETAPTSYEVPITAPRFHHNHQAALTPTPRPTIIHRIIPPTPNITQLQANGLRDLENRGVIIQCVEALEAVSASWKKSDKARVQGTFCKASCFIITPCSILSRSLVFCGHKKDMEGTERWID